MNLLSFEGFFRVMVSDDLVRDGDPSAQYGFMKLVTQAFNNHGDNLRRLKRDMNRVLRIYRQDLVDSVSQTDQVKEKQNREDEEVSESGAHGGQIDDEEEDDLFQ